MSNTSWSEPVSEDIAYRRAARRNSYNRLRRRLAELRRERIVTELWPSLREHGIGCLDYGVKAHLARALEVSKATITRDYQAIFAAFDVEPCPVCLSLIDMDEWQELEEKGRVTIDENGHVRARDVEKLRPRW